MSKASINIYRIGGNEYYGISPRWVQNGEYCTLEGDKAGFIAYLKGFTAFKDLELH